MKSYIVVLKLNFSEDTYLNLINYFKTASYWAKPLPNVWFIKTNRMSSELRDGIMSRITNTDKVLVIAVNNSDWASYNLDKVITDWMKSDL